MRQKHQESPNLFIEPVDYTHIKKWNNIPREKWDDWHWQLQNAVRSIEEFSTTVGSLSGLSSKRTVKLAQATNTFEMKLTPHTVFSIYRAMKLHDHSGERALLATFVPSTNELAQIEDGVDSIGEDLECSKPAPLVTNFYGNRVLLFAANMCPSYCRFCFRRRKVGDRIPEEVEHGTNANELRTAMSYISRNKAVREVIISGGDPLTLGDDRLMILLDELKGISHIEIVRIDTKVFTTLPQRIDAGLIDVLQRFRPLYIVGNFLHSIELTKEAIKATSSLIDAGIPVLSHTPLLKGINDDKDTLAELMWNLYKNRISPYYLIQFIPTKWTEHFRVPLERGMRLVRHLQTQLPGISNPTYIIYLPNGAGKVPVSPNYLLERTADGYYFRSFSGRRVLYSEPRKRRGVSSHRS